MRLHRAMTLEKVEEGRGFIGLCLGLVIGFQLVFEVSPRQVDGLGLGGALQRRSVDLEHGILHSRRLQVLQHFGLVLSPERPGVLDLLAEGLGEIVEMNPVTDGVYEIVGRLRSLCSWCCCGCHYSRGLLSGAAIFRD